MKKRIDCKTAVLLFLMGVLSSCGGEITSRQAPVAALPSEPLIGIVPQVVSLSPVVKDLDAEKGIGIQDIVYNSPAAQAGLRIGDTIIAYDGHVLPNTSHNTSDAEILNDFREYIQTQKKVGDVLTLRVLRPSSAIDPPKKNAPIQPIDITLHLTQPRWMTVRLPNDPDFFTNFITPEEKYVSYVRRLVDRPTIAPSWRDLMDRYAQVEVWEDPFQPDLLRYIRHNPLALYPEMDRLSDRLMDLAQAKDVPGLISSMQKMMNASREITPLDEIPAPPPAAPLDQHIAYVTRIIEKAETLQRKAIRRIDPADQIFFSRHIHEFMNSFCGGEDVLPFNSPDIAARHLHLLEIARQMDPEALAASTMWLSRLGDRNWLAELKTTLANAAPTAPADPAAGFFGPLIYSAPSSVGRIVIGGARPNRYAMSAAVIIDAGGDDLYTGFAAAAKPEQPIAVVIDLAGNDYYAATAPAAIAGGILGVGMLIDYAGDDRYQSSDSGQGVGLLGIGILMDFSGNDIYQGSAFNQGAAFWGMGLLLDFSGDDQYRSGLLAQGVGGPMGIGLLFDGEGRDIYEGTGQFACSYGMSGIFNGLSQGVGMGIRGHAAGGIGMLLDAGGEDRFLAGNFSQGGGYASGLGLIKNCSREDDTYIASRYGQGFAAHSAAGILIDQGGDDHYSGYVGALQAAAWDKGIAVLVDESGDDVYNTENLFFTQAAAAHNGLALLIDKDGKDAYAFPKTAKITDNSYHGGNSFSIFIDSGGAKDTYNDSPKPNDRACRSENFAFRADLGNPPFPIDYFPCETNAR